MGFYLHEFLIEHNILIFIKNQRINQFNKNLILFHQVLNLKCLLSFNLDLIALLQKIQIFKKLNQKLKKMNYKWY